MSQAEHRYRFTSQCMCAVVFALAAASGKFAYAGCGDYLMPLGVIHGVDMQDSDPHAAYERPDAEFSHPYRRAPRCQGPGCGQTPAHGSDGLMAPMNSTTGDQQFENACDSFGLMQNPPTESMANNQNELGCAQALRSGPFRPPRSI